MPLTSITKVKSLVSITSLLFVISMIVDGLQTLAEAQITTPILNDTKTIIDQTGNTINIRGGAEAGKNLFHSFEKFGLNEGQIANFLSNSSIQNILGRVIGGDASIINGLIKVTGGNSNLYLMNPVGIVFGPNAKLDIPGAFIGTTANGIGINNHWFNAEGTNNYNNLKETPSVLAFSLEKPGAIVNAAENLELSNKRLHLVLVGGTVVNTKPISLESISIATVLGQEQVGLDYTYDSSSGRQIPRLEATTSLPNNNLPTNWTRTPKSLPELLTSVPQLLTGGNAENANKLTVDSDGTVLLTGSGVQVQNGDVVLNGKVSTSFNSDSRYSSTSNSISILAAGNVLAQDIEANGSGIKISGTSITVGNIQRTYAGGYSGFNNDQPAEPGVNLNATVGNISAGNINTNALSIKLSAQGGISASEIRTYRSDLSGNASRVDLKAKTGNIQVTNIFAGSGGIDVITPGTFRAIGTNTSSGSATEEVVVGKSPELIEFLVGQGVARERLTGSNAKITVSSSARGNVVTSGSVNITHGGEARPTPNGDRITIKTIPGGSGLFDFVSGGFVPGSEGLQVERGNPQNFDSGNLRLRRIYREVNPLETPENVSAVAGIVTLDPSNQQLIGSLESRLFVPPPTPPDNTPPPANTPPANTPPTNTPPADNTPPPSNNNPLSESQQQTAQRQVNQQTNSACNPSNTVVMVSNPNNSISLDRNTKISSPSTGANIPCSTTQDEQQILQILNETPNLDQNKKLYFDSSYPRLPNYAEQVTFKN